MFPNKRFPLVLESRGPRRLGEWLSTNKGRVDEQLLHHGALLFRGFEVQSVEAFDDIIGALSSERVSYIYRSTPRTLLGNSIYTATEYPEELEIPLHCENAYQRTWPLRVAFCCLTPSTTGGETPLADLKRVSLGIGPELMETFEARRVKYIRHYRSIVDLSWQVVFQTADRNDVARFCDDNDMQQEWLDDDTLRTTQVCQGVAYHPITHDRVFFNQAHLFHASSVGQQQAELLLTVFGRDRLPRHSCFGDGGEISAVDLAAIMSAFQAESITFPWMSGDVLLLDNMQVAHGRRPFTGKRKLLASLLEPYSTNGAGQPIPHFR
jgi:alpha-ketoglutarate-dependent taurine dioxygenase